MGSFFVFDPSHNDIISSFRGGGRMVQILKENLSESATFITKFSKVTREDTLLIPYFNPFQKPLLSRRIAKKQIIMIFDVIPLKYPEHFPIGIKGKINLFLNKKSLKHFDIILTISHHSKKGIATYLNIPPEKIKVIYPPVSNVFFKNLKSECLNSKQIQNPNNQNAKHIKRLNLEHLNLLRNSDLGFRNYCIYVGDVNWNKNLVNLARAIKIANIPCIFVGKMFGSKVKSQKSKVFTHSWQKEFLDFLTEINDDPRFIFAGYKSDEDLIKLYTQARLNILVSHDEGFGFSYIEASTLGCPSVLSAIDIFHEIADTSALFANPEDPRDIAAKIRQIFDDDALRTKLSLKAQERSLYFVAEKFKKEWDNLF